MSEYPGFAEITEFWLYGNEAAGIYDKHYLGEVLGHDPSQYRVALTLQADRGDSNRTVVTIAGSPNSLGDEFEIIHEYELRDGTVTKREGTEDDPFEYGDDAGMTTSKSDNVYEWHWQYWSYESGVTPPSSYTVRIVDEQPQGFLLDSIRNTNVYHGKVSESNPDNKKVSYVSIAQEGRIPEENVKSYEGWWNPRLDLWEADSVATAERDERGNLVGVKMNFSYAVIASGDPSLDAIGETVLSSLIVEAADVNDISSFPAGILAKAEVPLIQMTADDLKSDYPQPDAAPDIRVNRFVAVSAVIIPRQVKEK